MYGRIQLCAQPGKSCERAIDNNPANSKNPAANKDK
jgi:hypothetical protein